MVKPSGYLMVEGVAQSVNQLLDLLDDLAQQRLPTAQPGQPIQSGQLEQPGQSVQPEQPFVPGVYRPAPGASAAPASHIPPKPRATRALYWLLAPPPPAKQEPFTAGGESVS
jgi:hypothetical protein